MTHVDTPQSRLVAGMACCDITPPVGIYHRMWGAAKHDRATGVHRPLVATALWLAPRGGAAGAGHLLVALDHCILEGRETAKLREAAARALEIEETRVDVALSHTHGSGWLSRSRSELPGGELIGPYFDRLAEQMAELATQARESAQPATICYGYGRCALAGQRDFFDEERGTFVCGFNPAGPADDTLLVGQITADNGRALGTIVNYACHPTTLAWDNTLLSPDWVGAMREVVESATGGPCLFLQGASGDLGPREGFVGDTAVADRNGRQVGYAALSTLESLPPPSTRYQYAGPVVSGTLIGTWKHQPLDADALTQHEAFRWRTLPVDLPYRHDLPTLDETRHNFQTWQAEEHAAAARGDERTARELRAKVEQMRRQTTRLEALAPGKTCPIQVRLGRMGDAVWVIAPGELYQVFQQRLRERFAPRPVVVATVANDWQPGYLPQVSSYGYGIYQDVIAAVAPGGLETLLEEVSRAVRTELLGTSPTGASTRSRS